MRRNSFWAPIIAGFLGVLLSGSLAAGRLHAQAASGDAHHYSSAGVPAIYFVNRSVTVTGTVKGFLFKNPGQMFVRIHSVGENGARANWLVEWSGQSRLEGIASPQDLRVGDRVVITGNPARDPKARRIFLHVIARATD